MNSRFSWCSRSAAFTNNSSRTAAAALLLLVVGLPAALRGAEKVVPADLHAIASKQEAANSKVTAKPIAKQVPKLKGLRAGEERDFEIAPGVKMKMCWIPPGEFLMGSPEGELGHQSDETQHRVKITKGFWMGKYEVTQAQWRAVMGNNPSEFKGKDRPVEQVSWDDISKPGGFLEKANKNVVSGERFYLPTEAQWEYACRAGTTTSLNIGKNITTDKGICQNMDKVSWYRCNRGKSKVSWYGGIKESGTHPVGQKMANAWGLYDMHGNVLEWCSDRRSGDYPATAVVDPHGSDSNDDANRVLRGGHWNGFADECRAASRSCLMPSNSDGIDGFRVARSSVP